MKDILLEMKDILLDMIEEVEESDCKGLIYRCRINAYIDSRGTYVYQEKMIPMKKLSCKGCKECGWLKDGLNEFVIDNIYPIIEDPIDGELYTLGITNESRDLKTGIINDWDMEFVRIKY